MAETDKNTIKVTVLLPLTVAILVLLVAFLTSIYCLQKRNINEDLRSSLDSVRLMFQVELDEDAELMAGLVDFLEHDQHLQTAWLADDRDALLRCARPIFEQIRSKYRVTHFYFHRPDTVCFLRVHDPRRYGDYTDCFTIDRAVRSQKLAHGIELGPSGTFVLRVVKPWRINGKVVGYIELGEEIAHIIQELRQVVGVELFFTIDKSCLDRTMWQRGMKMMGRQADWDRFDNFVLAYQTLPQLPPVLERYLKVLPARSQGPQLSPVIKMAAEARDYQAGFFPLMDAGGRAVGDVVVLSDITAEHAALGALSALLILIGTSIAVALFAFFYVHITRIEQKLRNAYDALKTEVEEHRRSKEKIQPQNEFLNNVLESLKYPFYVVNTDDYTIAMANSAANVTNLSEKPTCHKVRYGRDEPCTGPDIPCPLRQAKDTKKPVIIEHVHHNNDGRTHNIEVHCYPVIDGDGNVGQVIEYCLDITDRKKAEQDLQKHLTQLERFNRLAVGRELRMVELKKEINGFLDELGREEKYRNPQNIPETSACQSRPGD